ncbi:MAG: hypothetical protein LBH01_02080 [Verrucomicrobiales bacterium]|jgi:hypothetical protein|nr:hypothetical protein [Verrucomicrobiales bacterium]
MYENTAAAPRGEITELLEAAADTEKFLIADKIFPVHEVDRMAGWYPRLKIKEGSLLRAESTKRGPTGSYNEISRAVVRDNYRCEDRGLVERVDDVLAEQYADFFDMEVVTARLVSRPVKFDHEREVAGRAFDSEIFTTLDPAAPYTEAGLADIDFARDLQDAQERLTKQQVEPNTLVLSLQLWNRVRRSVKLQRYLFGDTNLDVKKLITPQHIADAFMIPNILVAKATYDVSAKGKEPDLRPIWSSDFFGIFNVQAGDFQLGGVGRTLSWRADVPGGLFATETYRDEGRRGDMVRVRCNVDEKVIDEASGVLVETGWTV